MQTAVTVVRIRETTARGSKLRLMGGDPESARASPWNFVPWTQRMAEVCAWPREGLNPTVATDGRRATSLITLLVIVILNGLVEHLNVE